MFENYAEEIFKLEKFEKKDLLTENFKLQEQNKIKIFYAPHNEIVNKEAKIFIVGITPGWTQTSIAYKTASDGLRKGLSYEEIKKECKRNSRFSGSMRKNLIEMLDELKLYEKLELNSCNELFDIKDHLLHTTSVIPYPVFVSEKNYTGHSPKILDNQMLYGYVKKYFYNESKLLSNALIIPLGKAVDEILEEMIKEGVLQENNCLLGFPHPSGANGHRKEIFNKNKEQLLSKIDNYFSV